MSYPMDADLHRARRQVQANDEAVRLRVLDHLEARARATNRTGGARAFLGKWGRAIGAAICLIAAGVVAWQLAGFFLGLSAFATLAFYVWGFGFICGAVVAVAASFDIQLYRSGKFVLRSSALSNEGDWVGKVRRQA